MDPLQDQLLDGIGRRIFIRLRNRSFGLSGVLKMFDVHLNLILDDAREVPRNPDGKNAATYGRIIVRGDSIVMISF
ncbi:MAG: LSm family protein [Promethearchaeota archaeon]